MKNLTTYHWLFIAEYLVDFDATAACKRAGYVGVYARAEGAKLLRHTEIKAELQKCMAETVSKTKLTVQDVINDIANVLRADPRDLVEHWQGACRYCYGFEHRHQRTLNEYRRDELDAIVNGKEFHQLGGTGFNARREPHPECPECWGEGEPYERIKDTRELTPEQAALYAGVERTKYGTKINMRSKDSAREAAARYLGMNKETVDVNVKKISEMTDEQLEALVLGKTP